MGHSLLPLLNLHHVIVSSGHSGSSPEEDMALPSDAGPSSHNGSVSGWLAFKAIIVIFSHILAEQIRELKGKTNLSEPLFLIRSLLSLLFANFPVFEFLAWGGGAACLGITAGGIVCFVRIRYRQGADVTCCLTIPSSLATASLPGLSGDVDLTGLSTRVNLDSGSEGGENREMLEISASCSESQIIDSPPQTPVSPYFLY
jgi:hypothetical protein